MSEWENQPALLTALVRRHMTANANDKEATRLAAVQEIIGDSDLMESILHEIVSQAVDRYVRRALTSQRDRAIAVAMEATQHAKARSSEALQSLLDFPMATGAKLSAAVRPEVQETAAHYMTSGTVQVQRGLWLTAVATKLPDDDTPVGDVMDALSVKAMFDAAVNKVRKMGLPYGD